MSLPKFCQNCTNIIGYPNLITGLSECNKCRKQQELHPADKIIAVSQFNKGNRTITNNEIVGLAHETTTQRINLECTKCKYNIMALIHDEKYQVTLVCLSCDSIYKH